MTSPVDKPTTIKTSDSFDPVRDQYEAREFLGGFCSRIPEAVVDVPCTIVADEGPYAEDHSREQVTAV